MTRRGAAERASIARYLSASARYDIPHASPGEREREREREGREKEGGREERGERKRKEGFAPGCLELEGSQ
eukprot:2370161-Rhodomonas_salina.2